MSELEAEVETFYFPRIYEIAQTYLTDCAHFM